MLPLKQFLNYSLAVCLPTPCEEVRKRVIGSHSFASVCCQPLGRGDAGRRNPINKFLLAVSCFPEFPYSPLVIIKRSTIVDKFRTHTQPRSATHRCRISCQAQTAALPRARNNENPLDL
jgi:hypothetical protein